jgi:hypothetical protein
MQKAVATEESSKGQSWLGSLVMVLFVLSVLCLLAPNYLRTAHRRPYMSCRCNLKNIATALDMYSTDNQGLYPPAWDQLCPAYLKSAPYCDSNRARTYNYQTIVQQKKPGFVVSCAGQHQYYGPFLIYSHVGPGYPQFNSFSGLISE